MTLKILILFIVMLYYIAAFSIDFISPPRIDLRPETIRFRAAESENDNAARFQIQCSTSFTNPSPSFKWEKNGEHFVWEAENGRIVESISDNDLEQYLTFNLARSSDAGNYQCFATNQYGVATGKNFTVVEVKKNIKITETSATANRKGTTKFFCDCKEVLYPEFIKWYKLKKNKKGKFYEKNVVDSKHRIDGEGNLWFLNVELEDDSKFGGYESPYYCNYTDSVFDESFIGSQIFLKVIDNNNTVEPAITPLYISSNYTEVRHGNPQKLYCIHGGENLSVRWLFNGEESAAFDDEDIRIDHHFVSTDVGLYSCHVTNNITTVSHEFKVVLDSRPTWKEYQYHADNIPEDEDKEFICITNENDTTQYEWFVNAESIADSNVDDRWILSPNKLIIKNVQPSDVGVIGCKATRNNESIYDENILTIRSNAPQFYYKDKVYTILFIDDDEELISCNHAGPIPTFKCLKDGIEINSTDHVKISSSSLHIKNITADDAGIYECTVSNKHGMDTIKKVVTVYRKPHFYTDVRRIYTKLGETAVFECVVDNDYDLDLNYVWRFDYQDLKPDDNHILGENKSLIIKNFSKSDVGFYYCGAGKNETYTYSTDVYSYILD